MKYGVELHWDDLSSVFTTVGYADTPLHPQLFTTVTFESQRSTEEERSWSLLLPSAFIARGRTGHTLYRASELAGGRGYAS